jgi:hypothetical protein
MSRKLNADGAAGPIRGAATHFSALNMGKIIAIACCASLRPRHREHVTANSTADGG